MFHLLQNRVWPAIDESVASKNENGQAVGMGHACGGDHIGGTGAN